MNDFVRDFLKGVLSATIVSVAASSIAVYVATSVQDVEIKNLSHKLTAIEKKLEKITDDIYQTRF